MTSLKIDKRIFKKYYFYGNDKANIKPINNNYKYLSNLLSLYDILNKLWNRDTCAPRLQKDWNENNRTLGQCSITSFLIQDIFGGEVYGVPLENKNFHCFNVIDGNIYDLTSEQFSEKLEYTLNYPQDRKNHFEKEEKYQRYLLLKNRLEEYLK